MDYDNVEIIDHADNATKLAVKELLTNNWLYSHVIIQFKSVQISKKKVKDHSKNVAKNLLILSIPQDCKYGSWSEMLTFCDDYWIEELNSTELASDTISYKDDIASFSKEYP